MELMRIGHLKNRSFKELSGGQRQKALLARALCATEELILLDEPTAGLDPAATEELYELISKLNREEGVAVIMISHDPVHAKKAASHILHLGRRMLYSGPAAEYDREAVLAKEKGGKG